jgi:hypothetical protein
MYREKSKGRAPITGVVQELPEDAPDNSVTSRHLYVYVQNTALLLALKLPKSSTFKPFAKLPVDNGDTIDAGTPDPKHNNIIVGGYESNRIFSRFLDPASFAANSTVF